MMDKFIMFVSVTIVLLNLVEAKIKTDNRSHDFVEDRFLDLKDLKIHLYTRKNVRKPWISKILDVDALRKSHFSPSRQTIFYVHGWLETCRSTWSSLPIKDAALRKADVNYLCLDWGLKSVTSYGLVLSAIPNVGEIFALFLDKFMADLNVVPDSLTLVGFSFGAQVVGIAGAFMKKKVKIIGLDPARHGFQRSSLRERLDSSDGTFVQIIHGNGGMWGIQDNIGHADYYPNGGLYQAGCPQNVFDYLFCNHLRTPLLYAESLLTGNFIAKKCDNYTKYLAGECQNNNSSYMGEMNIDTRARGKYFIQTSPKPPYAILR